MYQKTRVEITGADIFYSLIIQVSVVSVINFAADEGKDGVFKVSRVILLSDINNFYAGVECFYNREIRSLPVAVCGDIKLRHGIVLAKNPIAKCYGVKTGETIGSAKTKCPELVIVPPHMDLYYKFSKWVREIYEEYADNIEEFGLDEAWLEVTNIARDEWEGRLIADEIRIKIREKLGLTCSIGVSWNKILSKLASDLYKVDATAVITHDNYREIVWQLPTDNLLFINRKTKQALQYMGINTIGDLANAPVELLEKIFGKVGRYLHKYANGNENSPVKHKDYIEPPKSIGNIETTPRDMLNTDDVKRVIYMLSESVASRLRDQNYKCRTVKVYIRDFELQSCERQGKLEQPTYLTNIIAGKAMEVFKTRYSFIKPLRSIGVRACDLVSDDAAIQSSFFYTLEQDEKIEKIENMIDILRAMYGYDVLQRGIVLEDKMLTYIPADYNRSNYRIDSGNIRRDY